jgi:hypothetical protein
MADCTKYRPCTDADQKALLAVPGILNSVKNTLRFPAATEIQIIAEAVSTTTDGSLKYLVMGGVDIEEGDDNREGYWWIKGDQILKSTAIVLPTLS